MSRSLLTDITTDVQDDGGSLLWSFVQGEQLEFEVTVNFLTNADAGYTYEAVIVEAANSLSSEDRPTTIQPAGAQTTLVVRVPPEQGVWNAGTAYDGEDVVYYVNSYYKRLPGTAVVSSNTPDQLIEWEVFIPNKVYIQFPSTTGATWAVQPIVGHNVYGFFELSVTEPSGGTYQRTWKPLRGMVEILFSPTHLVP